jgi:hypothetical protein
MMLACAKIYSHPTSTYTPKTLQVLASGRGVIGNATI